MNQDDDYQLNLKAVNEESFIWIGVVFVNHRIRTKVYANEPFSRLLTFLLGVEQEYVLGLFPMKKRKVEDDEEEKKPSKKKNTQSFDNELSEMEDGQIHIPDDVVSDIQKIVPDEQYLVVYIRHKSEVEVQQEQQQAQADLEADGEKSNRFMSSPRKQMMKKFQKQGLNLNDCYTKVKRQRGDKRILICPFVNCQKGFSETGNLKTHLRTHTGERPFVCSFEGCTKQFITKGHLKTHELIHSGDKPYQCDRCGKSYSRSGRLKIHQRTHTGEKPFICDVPGCGKTFTEKGNLKTHQRIHSGEKPFTCKVPGCQKMFTTQGHLTDHMRRHSGDRPFKCLHCGQAFMRSSTLKIHIRRHTGEKPYQCNQCGKRFSESGNLKTHERTHMNRRKKVLNVKQRMNNQANANKQEQQKSKRQASVLGKRRKNTQDSIDTKFAPQVKNNNHQPIVIETFKKRSHKLLSKQQNKSITIKKENVESNEELYEAEQITLPLDSNFPQNQQMPDSIQEQKYANNMQNMSNQNNPNIQFTPKIINSVTNSTAHFGYPQQIGSPQFISQYNNGLNTPQIYFPTSLSGYQPQQNPQNNLSYQSNQSNSTVVSKQPSFQNLFASLQNNNQSGFNAMNNQGMGQNGLSPSTKGGVVNQNYLFTSMSPMGNQQFEYGNGSFGGFSPDNQKKYNQQLQQQQNQQSITQPYKPALEKWKGMGSFSSMTSLNDLIMNQKQVFQQTPTPQNQLQYSFSMQPSPGPVSKQNSYNNLLSVTGLNKQPSQDKKVVKRESKNDLQQQLDQQYSTQQFYVPNQSDSTTFRKLQKSHSLKNLFSSSSTAFQRFQEHEQIVNYQQASQQNQDTVSQIGEESFSSIVSKLKKNQ